MRAYTQTTGTWLRGMLQDQFDVDLSRLHWVTFEPAHVDGYVDPPNTTRAPAASTLAGMLRTGEIDAAAGLEPAEHPDLRTLLPDPQAVDADWFHQTGIRPINHTLVARRDLLQAHRWLANELYRMVAEAKQRSGAPAPKDGLEPNRGALSRLARYAFEQHITPRSLTPEELFSAE